MFEILGFLLAGVPIYGFIILKREGKEISPNSKGGNTGKRIGGYIGHCTGAGMQAIVEKFSTNKNDG